MLSAEFLVYSLLQKFRASPVWAVLQIGKENVEIQAIEPVGNYAVKLIFSVDMTRAYIHGIIFMSWHQIMIFYGKTIK